MKCWKLMGIGCQRSIKRTAAMQVKSHWIPDSGLDWKLSVQNHINFSAALVDALKEKPGIEVTVENRS